MQNNSVSMANCNKEILSPDILMDGFQTRGLNIQHDSFFHLKRDGVTLAGLDLRSEGCLWGEGMSSTHLIYIVLEGVVSHETHSISAHPNEILVIPASIPKRLYCNSKKLRAVYIHVGHQGDWKLLDRPKPFQLQGLHTVLIDQLMEAIMSEAHFLRTESAEAIHHLAILLLHYLRRDIIHTGNPLDQQQKILLKELWYEVERTLHENWNVDRMSSKMHLSSGHFHRLVKRLDGCSPMDKLKRIKIEQALGLLNSTSLTLSTIADRLGFSSAFAFSNFFKKYTGLRPGQYREKV